MVEKGFRPGDGVPLFSDELAPKPRLGVGGHAGLLEGATAIGGTTIGEVNVPIARFPAFNGSTHVADELGVPFGNVMGGPNCDGFSVFDFGLEDDNPPNEDLRGGDTKSIRSPGVAGELGAAVPLLRPLRAEGAGGFVVVDGDCAGIGGDHVRPAGVDDGFICDGVAEVIREGNGEGKFDHRLSLFCAVGLSGVGFEGEGFPVVGKGFYEAIEAFRGAASALRGLKIAIVLNEGFKAGRLGHLGA